MNQAQSVLAVYPNARGFAFALLEGPDDIFDWGIAESRAIRRQEHCSRKVDMLLNKLRPDVLVVRGSLPPQHSCLLTGLFELAEERGITALSFSRQQIREAFSTIANPTRNAIVSEVIRCLPAFKAFRPGKRKIWNGEDVKMGLFDAIALGLAFYSMGADRKSRQ